MNNKRTVGPVDQAPCPWCKKPNNLREIQQQQMLEKGARIDCDHCKRHYVVAGIDTRPRVILKQYHGG